MTFEEVLPALRAGKRVKQNDWDIYEYLEYNKNNRLFVDENGERLLLADRLVVDSDSWEIIDNYADTPTDIPSDALSAWHDGYDTGYKVGKNDTLLKIRDYVNEMKE